MKTWFWRNSSFFRESSRNPWGKLLALMILVLGILGCAHTATKPADKDWRVANIHKVVIVCVQGDSEANRRVESYMVPKLRHQGFDAIAAQELFSAAGQYSPKDLIGQLHKARIDGIMEIIYSGELPADGLPREIKFKYHAVRDYAGNLPDSRRPLISALIALIGS